LADQPRGLHRVWREVQATLARIHSAGDDDAALRRVGLSTLTVSLRDWLNTHPTGAGHRRWTVRRKAPLNAFEGRLDPVIH